MNKLEFKAEYRIARQGFDTQCEAVQIALADNVDSQWSRHQARLSIARELFVAKQRAAKDVVRRDLEQAGLSPDLRTHRGREELRRRAGLVLKIEEGWRGRVARWSYGNH